MEPVTHILTGACLARTGLNRKAAYTTLAMAVAAEFPDIDTLWGLRGPVESFQHHRGITHTFIGIPFEAALLLAGLYGLHRWRKARREQTAIPPRPGDPTADRPVQKPLTVAPVRWGLLYLFTLLALLSHLWLDYTNNYGLRPFFPFNPHWYAGSIVFIFDPLIFLLLLLALVLPALFRLIGSEVGARREPFAARGWAVATLLLIAAVWGFRFEEHAQAERLSLLQSYSQSAPQAASVEDPAGDASATPPLPAVPPTILSAQRTLVSPDPVNPFRWYSVVDFGPLYQLGTVDLRAGTYIPQQGIEPKLEPSAVLLAAERSPLGKAYLDWSSMPFLHVIQPGIDGEFPNLAGGAAAAAVTFRDPRFLGENPWLHGSRARSPLTGEVELDTGNHVIGERMDGKAER